MKVINTLLSKIDKSVNFIFDNGAEARYVRRDDNYIIVYLSSQNGCNKSCRMCHLTQTGQTQMIDITADEFELQAKVVIEYYNALVVNKLDIKVDKVHFNFMARGEPLANSTLCSQWEQIAFRLGTIATKSGFKQFKFNISTIIPTTNNKRILPFSYNQTYNPEIYYSLYSLDHYFRKTWLPKAERPVVALEELSSWQRRTSGKITLHWCLIESRNDSLIDASNIIHAIDFFRIRAKFNLVRYNPYSENKQGKEPSDSVINAYFLQMQKSMSVSGSRIVPRVGHDVAASCGMFIN